MMMMVVLIFIVCWLPYHTYFITANINPDINNSHYIQEIYLMIYWLAMSNSMYNPMIYCYMNQRFVLNNPHFAQFKTFMKLLFTASLHDYISRFRKGFEKVLNLVVWWRRADPLTNTKLKRMEITKVGRI